MTMRIFDCHSHWSTRRGHIFQTDEARASQMRIWGTQAQIETEAEFVATLRRNAVRAVLDLAVTAFKDMSWDEIRDLHDYAFAVQRANPDVIFGHWLSLDPAQAKEGVAEFHRARGANGGFIGFGIVGQTPRRQPASDPAWDPFYKASIEVGVPVLIHAGLTGIGQGFAGGAGIVLDDAHPRHIDIVAARFPELKILAARPAWPWQDEMIAVLLHKSNVHYELHGWSPKAFTSSLKREIGGRLQDRIMIGCDYPVLKYEMIAQRWKGLGYSHEVLEKVFFRNAESYFPGATLV
jgi:predicted TIM-barrel fold metal-dependent hydrolase